MKTAFEKKTEQGQRKSQIRWGIGVGEPLTKNGCIKTTLTESASQGPHAKARETKKL